MGDGLEFISVKRIKLHEGYGLEIVFSDGTVAHYAPEELVALRPHRDFLRPETFH